MTIARGKLPSALVLAIGLALGWVLAQVPAPTAKLRASGGDRSGDSIVATGPIMLRYNEGSKVQIPLDAVYYLDYRAGKLIATVPSFRQSFGPAKLIDEFAERDLVADFKLDVDNGPRPHFLMTTGSLGTYSDGWAPLFVFETTTNQVAVYKVEQQMVGAQSVPKFELVELRALARDSRARASR